MKSGKTLESEFPSGRVYWTRFVLAIVAAFACFISKLSTQGLLIGALVYLLSFPVMIWAFNIRIQGKGHSFYTLGFGSYLFVWLTLWSLFNTYLPNS